MQLDGLGFARRVLSGYPPSYFSSAHRQEDVSFSNTRGPSWPIYALSLTSNQTMSTGNNTPGPPDMTATAREKLALARKMIPPMLSSFHKGEEAFQPGRKC